MFEIWHKDLIKFDLHSNYPIIVNSNYSNEFLNWNQRSNFFFPLLHKFITYILVSCNIRCNNFEINPTDPNSSVAPEDGVVVEHLLIS